MMNRERLEKSQETLRNVIATQKLFNIGVWFEEDASDLLDENCEPLFPGECGMVACVGGYCAIDPWHKAQGLDRSGVTGMPLYDGRAGSVALARYWGIDISKAEYVVYNQAYKGFERNPDGITAEMAIQHIQDILDGKEVDW